MPYLSVCVYTLYHTHLFIFEVFLGPKLVGIADDLALKEIVQMLHHQFSKKIPNLGPSGGSIALL